MLRPQMQARHSHRGLIYWRLKAFDHQKASSLIIHAHMCSEFLIVTMAPSDGRRSAGGAKRDQGTPARTPEPP